MAMSAFLQVWCRWWPSILRANVGNKFKLHFSCINIEWHPPNRHPPVQTTHPPHHVQKRISTIQEIHHTRLLPHLEWNRTLTTPDLHHTGHPPHQKFITSDIHHALCVKKGHVSWLRPAAASSSGARVHSTFIYADEPENMANKSVVLFHRTGLHTDVLVKL